MLVLVNRGANVTLHFGHGDIAFVLYGPPWCRLHTEHLPRIILMAVLPYDIQYFVRSCERVCTTPLWNIFL